MKNIIKNKITMYLCSVFLIASSLTMFFATAETINGVDLKKSDVFVAVKNITQITDKESLPSYSQIINTENNGVLIKTIGNEASFSYNGLIEANALTKDIDLIAFQAIAGADKAIVKRIEIRLSDSLDSSNRFGIVYTPALSGSNPGFNSYTRVLYNNVERGWGNMGENKIHQNMYGTMNRMQSFYGHNVLAERGEGQANIYRAKFDNNEKSVYAKAIGENDIVLDLSNPAHVGYGKEWNGFSSGLIKLDVFIEYEKEGEGGLIITRILGNNLCGDIAETDKVAPSIKISIDKEYENAMPVAAVNTAYKIPEAFSFDWYDGAKPATVAVLDSNSQDITSETVSNGYFTPKAVGNYKFKFTAQNSFGKNASSEISITVNNAIPTYIVGPDNLTKPLLFNYFVVPNINASGGSGKITMAEEFVYDGNKIELDEYRRIYIDKPGLLRINVEITGYTGDPYKISFPYIIASSDEYFTLRNIPSSITSGVETILPDFVMYKEVSSAQKKIFVDGSEINVNERKITINKQHGDTVLVKYQVTAGTKSTEKEFTLDVVDPAILSNFIIKEGGITAITTGQSSTKVEIASNGKIRMPYAVSTYDLGFRFGIGSGSNLSSFDVKLADSIFNEISYFLRITSHTSLQSFVQLNGVGQKYLISGGFGGTAFSFNIDNVKAKLKLANGDEVCSVPALPGYAANIEFIFNGVTKNSEFNLEQISNQMFTAMGFTRGDKTEPVLSLSKNIDIVTPVKFGENIKIYSAAAFDVLSYNSIVNVDVYSPQGELLYSGAADNDMNFPVTMKGYYSASYTVTDKAGNKNVNEFVFKVIDDEAPEITLNGNVPQQVKAGEQFTIANATVTDNFDEVELVVILFDNINFSRKVINVGEYTIKQKGYYTLIYYAKDTAYNISRIECSLFVV